jgi:hypothetical protein
MSRIRFPRHLPLLSLPLLILPPAFYVLSPDPPPLRVIPLPAPRSLSFLPTLLPNSITHIQPNHLLAYTLALIQAGVRNYEGAPNMRRITGRYEGVTGAEMKWGYAEAFEEDKVPTEIREIIKAIRKETEEDLGSVRDVTLNYREMCKL